MKVFTSNSQKIGKLGEDVASIFLTKKGFNILERNYTRKWGEIDIIAEKNKKLYFIEVKSVSHTFGVNNTVTRETFRPEENMHPSKLGRLKRIVETYLIHNRTGNREWQFDVLLVYIDLFQRKSKVVVIPHIIL
ncbi:MAG: YraN family protein [Candidatus Paceibacterota bacterium]